MKTIAAFTFAIACNASTWFVLIAESAAPDAISVIQLGGTAGLVAALMTAVITLWKDRNIIRSDMGKELHILRTALNEERNHHRAEVRELRETHKRDLDGLTERYLSELRQQIDQLKQETQQRFNEEREAIHDKYVPKPAN